MITLSQPLLDSQGTTLTAGLVASRLNLAQLCFDSQKDEKCIEHSNEARSFLFEASAYSHHSTYQREFAQCVHLYNSRMAFYLSRGISVQSLDPVEVGFSKRQYEALLQSSKPLTDQIKELLALLVR